MNIFYIDKDPKIAAKAMTDKHVVKMILESAQLLSTAHRVLDGYEDVVISKSGSKLKKYMLKDVTLNNTMYKSTHVNHPSAIWVRESIENYNWLYDHFIELGKEFTRRYNKNHASVLLLSDVLKNTPINIPKVSMTPVKVAISNKIWHKETPLESYRAYYLGEKINNEKDMSRYNFYINKKGA